MRKRTQRHKKHSRKPRRQPRKRQKTPKPEVLQGSGSDTLKPADKPPWYKKPGIEEVAVFALKVILKIVGDHTILK